MKSPEMALQEEIEAHRRTREKVQQYQDQLRELAVELALSEERERRLIAADLHDHIGQALAFIKMKLSTLQGNSIFCGFEDDISEILVLLKQTIGYTRNLTFEISPPILYEFGLEAALDWLGDNFQKKHHVKVSVITKGKQVEVSHELQVMLYKSVREILKNVEKHAQAQRVEILIKRAPDLLTMTVSDDGIGFDANALYPGSRTNRSFGLFSIRERMNIFGGEMQIDSSPGRGTRIVIEIPL